MYNDSITTLQHDVEFARAYYSSERNFQRLIRVLLTFNFLCFFLCIIFAVTSVGWSVLVQCVCAMVHVWCGARNADTLSTQKQTVNVARDALYEAEERLMVVQKDLEAL